MASFVFAFTLLSTSIARAATPTAAQVDAAVGRAEAYLFTQQNKTGTWETDASTPTSQPGAKRTDNFAALDNAQPGGRTALAVYSLLECGTRPTDERLQKAVQFLHTAPVHSTYGLAMKVLVWNSLPQTDEVKKSLRRDTAALIALKKTTGQNFLVWDYAATEKKSYSLQNTQSAAWGLAAAADVDYELPRDLWGGIERTFVAAQTKDGGWRNRFEADYAKATLAKPVTMFMTASGLATLFLAQDFTKAEAYANARGNATNPTIEKALDWMAKNFDQPADAKGEPGESMPRRLNGIEHVALASGLRRFGTHDWFADGSAWLVDKQIANGSWPGGTTYKQIDTCWALLFLQQGRTPVAFNKLDYSAGSSDPKKALWNQRPRDIANLTRWVGRATERELRWQVVTIDDSLDALLEAPVLYIAGGEALTLKPDAKAKLKAYVEHGGLIFAQADANAPAFSRSVEKLGTDLVAGSEWRDLPDGHPVFAEQMFKRAAFKTRPQVRAIGNGVRELVILVPAGDPAKVWQLRSGRANPEAWQLAADVLSYAVDKGNFYGRGTGWLAADPDAATRSDVNSNAKSDASSAPDSAPKPTRTITVARLKYPGPWDPEPAAWEQLAAYARTKQVELKTVTLAAGAAVEGVDAVYVTGTAALPLDDAARAALKAYLDGGGCVIFEAAGGNPAFAASAQAEITQWYGADALAVLPPDHRLFGKDLKVAYRPFNLASIDKPTAPQVRAVAKDGHVSVLLSREDLTAGLLGVPTDGITGYAPATARSMLLRVLFNLKSK